MFQKCEIFFCTKDLFDILSDLQGLTASTPIPIPNVNLKVPLKEKYVKTYFEIIFL